ncbi:MAG TPA: response regulator [Blastocatellia bacterium]|nr:response regulator [Blastocatellia bacterium]
MSDQSSREQRDSQDYPASCKIDPALEVAKGERFGLYVIDNHFPDGTGVELCRAIRSFDAETPLIIYSGTSTSEDLEEGLRAGAQAFVLKPYLDALLMTMAKLLNA